MAQAVERADMDGMIKTLMGRLLLFSACSVSATIVVALAFGRGAFLRLAGWAYFDYELANAISECSDVLQ